MAFQNYGDVKIDDISFYLLKKLYLNSIIYFGIVYETFCVVINSVGF